MQYVAFAHESHITVIGRKHVVNMKKNFAVHVVPCGLTLKNRLTGIVRTGWNKAHHNHNGTLHSVAKAITHFARFYNLLQCLGLGAMFTMFWEYFAIFANRS